MAAWINRLKLSNHKRTCCHKLRYAPQKAEACVLQVGGWRLPRHARQTVVALDAMGHWIHGAQENLSACNARAGRHCNAYGGDFCDLPLYVFAGGVPLWAWLRPSDRDAAQGGVTPLEKVVTAMRKRCWQARIRIMICGGSGGGRSLPSAASWPDWRRAVNGAVRLRGQKNPRTEASASHWWCAQAFSVHETIPQRRSLELIRPTNCFPILAPGHSPGKVPRHSASV